jgi:hypothetical protein
MLVITGPTYDDGTTVDPKAVMPNKEVDVTYTAGGVTVYVPIIPSGSFLVWSRDVVNDGEEVIVAFRLESGDQISYTVTTSDGQSTLLQEFTATGTKEPVPDTSDSSTGCDAASLGALALILAAVAWRRRS